MEGGTEDIRERFKEEQRQNELHGDPTARDCMIGVPVAFNGVSFHSACV